VCQCVPYSIPLAQRNIVCINERHCITLCISVADAVVIVIRVWLSVSHPDALADPSEDTVALDVTNCVTHVMRQRLDVEYCEPLAVAKRYAVYIGQRVRVTECVSIGIRVSVGVIMQLVLSDAVATVVSEPLDVDVSVADGNTVAQPQHLCKRDSIPILVTQHDAFRFCQ